MTEFDKLVKQVAKAHTVLREHGPPKFYLKSLVDLEAAIALSLDDKDAKKKMNATNAKALNAMKQKVRKHNKTLESEIEAWKKNPVVEGEAPVVETKKPKVVAKKKAAAVVSSTSEEEETSDEDESSDEDDSEDDVRPVKKAARKAAASTSEESEDSDESETETETETETASSDEEERPSGPSRWKKAAPTAAAAKKKPVEKEKAAPKVKQVVVDGEDKGVEGEDEKPKLQQQQGKELEITTETIYKRLKEVLEARGKKVWPLVECTRMHATVITDISLIRIYIHRARTVWCNSTFSSAFSPWP